MAYTFKNSDDGYNVYLVRSGKAVARIAKQILRFQGHDVVVMNGKFNLLSSSLYDDDLNANINYTGAILATRQKNLGNTINKALDQAKKVKGDV